LAPAPDLDLRTGLTSPADEEALGAATAVAILDRVDSLCGLESRWSARAASCCASLHPIPRPREAVRTHIPTINCRPCLRFAFAIFNPSLDLGGRRGSHLAAKPQPSSPNERRCGPQISLQTSPWLRSGLCRLGTCQRVSCQLGFFQSASYPLEQSDKLAVRGGGPRQRQHPSWQMRLFRRSGISTS
jgi:hypothetical protein